MPKSTSAKSEEHNNLLESLAQLKKEMAEIGLEDLGQSPSEIANKLCGIHNILTRHKEKEYVAPPTLQDNARRYYERLSQWATSYYLRSSEAFTNLVKTAGKYFSCASKAASVDATIADFDQTYHSLIGEEIINPMHQGRKNAYLKQEIKSSKKERHQSNPSLKISAVGEDVKNPILERVKRQRKAGSRKAAERQ